MCSLFSRAPCWSGNKRANPSPSEVSRGTRESDTTGEKPQLAKSNTISARDNIPADVECYAPPIARRPCNRNERPRRYNGRSVRIQQCLEVEKAVLGPQRTKEGGGDEVDVATDRVDLEIDPTQLGAGFRLC